MKNLVLLITTLSFILQPVSSSAQSLPAAKLNELELTQGEPVRVRYRSKRFKGKVKTVLIRDKFSGKRALLALPLKNAEEGLYEASFVILFDNSDSNSPVVTDVANLEVYPLVNKARVSPKNNLAGR